MTNPALAAPVPVPDPDTAPYWEGLKVGKLMLCRCDDTGKWIHPPLERSRYTGGPVHFEEVSGDGTVFSYIVVRQALVPGRVPPYVVGLVELVEQPGLRINAVIDALKDYGVRHLDMPATGPKLWSIIQAAQPQMAAE